MTENSGGDFPRNDAESARPVQRYEMKNPKKVRNILIAVAAVFALAAIVLGVLGRTLWATNASPKNAAGETFRAMYIDCDYEMFRKATCYDSECEERLNLELTGLIQNQVKPAFAELAGMLAEEDMTYVIRGTRATEYALDSAEFADFEQALRADSPNARIGDIQAFAIAEVAFRCRFTDEQTGKQTVDDTERYYCVRLDGRWYTCPHVEVR